jgi:NagD protein
MKSDALAQRLAKVRGLLLDMDGTIKIGARPIPQAARLFEVLRAQGRRFVLLTNNSSNDAAHYQRSLARMGYDMPLEIIVTSSEAAARMLLRETAWRRIFVLGVPSLARTIAAAGLEPVDERPDCILVGFDTTLRYERLAEACYLIQEGVPFVATHEDRTCIMERGRLPDAGAILAAIETTTGKRPLMVAGKPHTGMVKLACEKLGGLGFNQVMTVGDQKDTDLRMGLDHGIVAALLLSGETSSEALAASGLKPDLTLAHVGALADILDAHPPDPA